LSFYLILTAIHLFFLLMGGHRFTQPGQHYY
jgi:hypothetical protein